MKIVAPLLLALFVLLPACGDSGGGSPTVCVTPVEAETVVLSDFAFRPNCLQAPDGGQIELRNTGDAPHTFTIEGTTVDVNVPAGTSTAAGLSGVEPGRYTVTCTFHPQMEATLTVG